MSIALHSDVCSDTHTVGQRLSGLVYRSIQEGQLEPWDPGSEVDVTAAVVITALRPGAGSQASVMRFAVESISVRGVAYPLTGMRADPDIENVRASPRSEQPNVAHVCLPRGAPIYASMRDSLRLPTR